MTDVVWPGSAASADNLFLAASGAERVYVIDARHCLPRKVLSPYIDAFISRCPVGRPLLVKTSTTGNRAADSEVSAELLGTVLRLAISRLGRERVIVADGPAYARDYLAECRRLGWGEVLEETGVVVADLNQDGATEIASGWPVSSTFMTAGCILNLCRAKTHRRFGVSLSGKSLLGALSGGLLGYPKLVGRHAAVPWLVAELERQAPPIFSVIEGNPGVDGEGPMHAQPNRSHFFVFGEGCLGPDVRATVEMGFDPVLVPGLIRPGSRDFPELVVDWAGLRRTHTDFVPPAVCSWLYRSVRGRRRREEEFQVLWEGIRSRWRGAVDQTIKLQEENS